MTKYWILILVMSLSYAMENPHLKKYIQVFTIAGQNGLGSDAQYVKDLLGNDNVEIIPVGTPSYPDLGQSICMNYLEKAVKAHAADPGYKLIHATSQGTATALNFLAENKTFFHGAILEACMASGNSAIAHTLKGPLMNCPRLVNLPLSYYWIPYAAKFLFPLYWPAGRQPIKSLQTIAKIPIIIMHSKDDIQLPYEDAGAVYYGLKSHGNEQAYFISKEGDAHIEIANSYDKNIIQSILANYNLSTAREPLKSDLTPYQPDSPAFKARHDELIVQENNHKRLGYGLCAASLALTLKGIHKYFPS